MRRVWSVPVPPGSWRTASSNRLVSRPKVARWTCRCRLPIIPGSIAYEVLVATPNEKLAIFWWDTKLDSPAGWRTRWTLGVVPKGTMVTLSRRTFESDDPAVCGMAALSDLFRPAAMAKLRRLIDHAATTPTNRGGTEPHADEFAWLMDENTAVTQIDGV